MGNNQLYTKLFVVYVVHVLDQVICLMMQFWFESQCKYIIFFLQTYRIFIFLNPLEDQKCVYTNNILDQCTKNIRLVNLNNIVRHLPSLFEIMDHLAITESKLQHSTPFIRKVYLAHCPLLGVFCLGMCHTCFD